MQRVVIRSYPERIISIHTTSNNKHIISNAHICFRRGGAPTICPFGCPENPVPLNVGAACLWGIPSEVNIPVAVHRDHQASWCIEVWVWNWRWSRLRSRGWRRLRSWGRGRRWGGSWLGRRRPSCGRGSWRKFCLKVADHVVVIAVETIGRRVTAAHARSNAIVSRRNRDADCRGKRVPAGMVRVGVVIGRYQVSVAVVQPEHGVHNPPAPTTVCVVAKVGPDMKKALLWNGNPEILRSVNVVVLRAKRRGRHKSEDKRRQY